MSSSSGEAILKYHNGFCPVNARPSFSPQPRAAAAALHYHGQAYELTVPAPEGPIDFANSLSISSMRRNPAESSA